MHSLITVVNACHPAELDRLGGQGWPIWDSEPSSFPWSYGKRETYLLLEGDVTVMPEGGEPVCFGAGNQVNFAAGLSCHWHVHQRVRKRYRFC
ncbi:cupin domain-containing protein [Synechococcus lacustris C3-12m-Tous]|nr:cupin domain-containing protein [Synechococcus lacustris C3-12m-Tous]